VSTGTYTPLRGSVAERANEYLRRHIGEWVPNGQMAEALQSDSSAVIQSLRAAQERKLVERRNEGRLVFWRMPKKQPPAAEPDDDPPMQRTVAAPARDPALTGGLLRVRSAFDLVPRPPEDPEPECRNLDAPAQLAPAAPTLDPRYKEKVARFIRTQEVQKTRFAFWDDRSLEIRRGADVVVLSPEETRQLFRYLDRFTPVEEGA
jgi:hypothetical protein